MTHANVSFDHEFVLDEIKMYRFIVLKNNVITNSKLVWIWHATKIHTSKMQEFSGIQFVYGFFFPKDQVGFYPKCIHALMILQSRSKAVLSQPKALNVVRFLESMRLASGSVKQPINRSFQRNRYLINCSRFDFLFAIGC